MAHVCMATEGRLTVFCPSTATHTRADGCRGVSCPPPCPASLFFFLSGDAEGKRFAVTGDGVQHEPLHGRGRGGNAGSPAGGFGVCRRCCSCLCLPWRVGCPKETVRHPMTLGEETAGRLLQHGYRNPTTRRNKRDAIFLSPDFCTCLRVAYICVVWFNVPYSKFFEPVGVN